MSGGTGIIIGFLGSAAFFLVVFAVLESRSTSAPVRPKAEAPAPVRPVRVPPPRPPVVQAEIVSDEPVRPAQTAQARRLDQEADMEPRDDWAARRMRAVRKARERVTEISRDVQAAIIGEALRRANVRTPTDADRPSGERHG